MHWKISILLMTDKWVLRFERPGTYQSLQENAQWDSSCKQLDENDSNNQIESEYETFRKVKFSN